MAENLDRDQALEKVTEPVPDPITDKSLSAPILIFTLLLMVTLAWALYDELFGLRPWKGMQNEFADRYVSFLQKKVLPAARANVKDIQDSADYQDLQGKIETAKAAAKPELDRIAGQLQIINDQLAAIQDPFQDDRAQISAIKYKSDQTDSASEKASYQSEIDKIQNTKRSVRDYPSDDGKSKSSFDMNFSELQQRFNDLTAKKTQLTADQAAALKPQKDLQDKQDKYVQDHLNGLNETQVKGLINKYQNFDVKIQQINIPDANIVDRCESCHVGIREPIQITAQDMKGPHAGAFTSHPNKDLLAKHDPEKFGCTACHGGNGRATTSEEKAHGNYEHWLWPMYAKENMQSGCNQCHNKDVVLAGADVLNRGKELFMERGCVGCHKYEGFDRETGGLAKATQQIKQFEMDKENAFHQIEINKNKANDPNITDADARQLLADNSNINQRISQIDGRIQQLEVQTKYLLRDQKKVGPNLKEVKFKLKKEFIPEWLRDPQAFRPGTKMPTFRLSEEERKNVAAFIWQSGWDGVSLPQQQQGDAGHGKELLETRGCLACHSIGEGPNRVGGDFSANLSRVGDKDNY
ncbi:MAG TPA: c-type cytochrome, partial [Blastocatellia bacterium]|nr:c-type cytochrome [Blastocatellia bacterium]